MAAIIKREISAYFLSAIGYIVLAAFYIFGGFYFYMSVLMSNTTDLSYTFSSLFVIMIFVIPILTMRLFSEEKKQKTDQVLLTAPVSLTSIVLGKYFAALIMYLFCILITLVYAVIISFFNTPDWITVLGNFLVRRGVNCNRNVFVVDNRKSNSCSNWRYSSWRFDAVYGLNSASDFSGFYKQYFKKNIIHVILQ